MSRRFSIVPLPIATFLLLSSLQPVVGQEPEVARLEAEVERLAASAGGTVGVAAVHLESGRTLYLNGDESFPMASTYKVPIAVELLRRVDAGQLRLDSLVHIERGHLHPGSGTLTPLFDHEGVTLPLDNLVELMLRISDNSATDLVLAAAGGPEAVTVRMRTLGLSRIRVDRPTVRLIADWIGIPDLPSESVAPEEFEKLVEAVPRETRDSAASAFDSDPRDTATPREMTDLLTRIQRQEVLTPESSALLLDVMERSTTGEGRIKGMLPPDVRVAHKTGTIGGTTNDVGVIELPDGAGHVAITVFVKGSEREVPERERAIAQIARAAYDFFLYTSP